MASTKAEITQRLRAALLEDDEMVQALYEYELEEGIDYWYEGLIADQEEFVFAVTENKGHVAMVLITPDKTLYINETARDKLKEIWPSVYQQNIKQLIPMMVTDLLDGFVAVNGVKTQQRS